MENPKSDKNDIVNKAFKDHNNIWTSSTLSSSRFPQKTLRNTAKDLAYLVLSSTIMRKMYSNPLSRQVNSPVNPKCARFEFKLQGTKRIENKGGI